MNCTRRRLLAASLVLAVIAVGIGWAYRAYELNTKVGRARGDMRTIGKAYETYHTQNDKWPEKLEQVAPLLECGRPNLLDPWGQQYVVQIEDVTQPDGKVSKRPVVYCQPPGDRPRIRWPEE